MSENPTIIFLEIRFEELTKKKEDLFSRIEKCRDHESKLMKELEEINYAMKDIILSKEILNTAGNK